MGKGKESYLDKVCGRLKEWVPGRSWCFQHRIQSFPLNRVFPVSISAMMQPTDQISTAERGGVPSEPSEQQMLSHMASLGSQALTCLVIVHPAEDHLRGPVPAGHHVAGHLSICVPCQPKIQDLRLEGHREKDLTEGRGSCGKGPTPPGRLAHDPLTFSSQSSFTARLPGFRSWEGGQTVSTGLRGRDRSSAWLYHHPAL
jgi:hypothetical protein